MIAQKHGLERDQKKTKAGCKQQQEKVVLEVSKLRKEV